MAMVDRKAAAVHIVMAVHKVMAVRIPVAEHKALAVHSPMAEHILEEDTTATTHKHCLEMLALAGSLQQHAFTC